jgi:protein-S-isoprenylcysteine O-methyltransferase Ste14
LIRTGLFGRCRHPIYSAFFIVTLGHCLFAWDRSIGSWIAGAACLSLYCLGTYFRVHEEESLLADVHGEEFKRYQRSTPAFVPRVQSQETDVR